MTKLKIYQHLSVILEKAGSELKLLTTSPVLDIPLNSLELLPEEKGKT